MTRIAVIGNGKWAKNIVRTLEGLPDLSAVVCGPGEASPPNIDGVIIATPSATHAEVALPYIQRGLPTFIEKPMATSLLDAKRLLQAAEKSLAPVLVGHLHLYNPAFKKFVTLLPEIGKLRLVVSESMGGEDRKDCSVLWDWLPHDVSMALRIFGTSPTEVQARAFGAAGTAMYSNVMATYLFGEVPFVSVAGWTSPYKRRCLIASGEAGAILFDDRADKKLALYKAKAVSYPTYGNEAPLASEMMAFLKIAREKKANDAELEEGLAVVRLIACAEESADKGGKKVVC